MREPHVPAIDIECPACGIVGKVDEMHVGKTIKCRSCGNRFEVEVGDTYGLAEAPSARPKVAPAGPIRRQPPPPRDDADGADEEEEQKSWLEAWPTE